MINNFNKFPLFQGVLGAQSIYDFNGLTTQEILCQFFGKIQEIISSFNDLEISEDEKIKLINEQIEKLKNEELPNEVKNYLDLLIDNGTIENLINNTLLADIQNLTNRIVTTYADYYSCENIGCNIWAKNGTPNSQIDGVLNRMCECKMNSLIIPVHLNISGNVTDGFSFNKELSDEKLLYIIEKARSKNINDIIIKLHRTGSGTTRDIKWIDMWGNVIELYSNFCVDNNIQKIVIVNEQSSITDSFAEKWAEIINKCKSKNLIVMCSYAGFPEADKSVINELVDVIGINVYPKVVKIGESVTQDELNKRFYNYAVQTLKSYKEKYKKPIYITEIGATRNKDCLSNPAYWSFPTGDQSYEPQAMFVESAFTTFACLEKIVSGVYWWSADTEGKTNTFTFFDNPIAMENFKKYLKN